MNDTLQLLIPWAFVIVCFWTITFRISAFALALRSQWFINQLAKRVERDLSEQSPDFACFQTTLKGLLEKTYHEVFELRRRHQRRQNDRLMEVVDRALYVQEGCAKLIVNIVTISRHLDYNRPANFAVLLGRTQSDNNFLNRVGGLFSLVAIERVTNFAPWVLAATSLSLIPAASYESWPFGLATAAIFFFNTITNISTARSIAFDDLCSMCHQLWLYAENNDKSTQNSDLSAEETAIYAMAGIQKVS